MNQSTMEAYAEIDMILNLMDANLVKQVPQKLRNLFKEKKTKKHIKEIVLNIPLKEQNLNPETIAILSVLHYNYWCKDEQKKAELLKKYSKNEENFQKSLMKKYNSENLFKNKKT